MKIGVLEAGAPPRRFGGGYGSYGDMVRRLLGPGFDAPSYDVRAGIFPKDGDECQGFVITGSASGVYDPEPWIATLRAFIQGRSGAHPMIGFCFGHQVMAEAFGGKAELSAKGRAGGLHRYDIWSREPWMDGAASIALPVVHQDQVTTVGPCCKVLGGSDFTPFGLLAYPARRAISIQSHPEFDLAFTRALVEMHRPSLGDAWTDAAIASLDRRNDRDRVGGWIRRFLQTA